VENILCEVFMNEAKTKTNLMEEENPSVQTQKNVVPENETKISKLQLAKLLNQRKEWRGHNINALCWSFYCVNDNKKIDNKCHQLMRCFFCYPKLIETCNKKTKSRKGLISYYKTNGITCLKNHVDVNHVVLYNKFENVVNNFLKGNVERQLMKKCPSISRSSISNFFVAIYKQNDVEQQQFLEDFGLLVVKNNLPIQFVESVWLKKLCMHLCP
jgi:hypothetical protein